MTPPRNSLLFTPLSTPFSTEGWPSALHNFRLNAGITAFQHETCHTCSRSTRRKNGDVSGLLQISRMERDTVCGPKLSSSNKGFIASLAASLAFTCCSTEREHISSSNRRCAIVREASRTTEQASMEQQAWNRSLVTGAFTLAHFNVRYESFNCHV